MVTRKTRNCKEKRPITAFGQFILPLTAVMAVALLFLSVKLFFMDPNDAYIDEGKTEAISHDMAHEKPKTTDKSAAVSPAPQKTPAAVTKNHTNKKTSDIVLAKPVEVSKKTEKPKPIVKQGDTATKQNKKVVKATSVTPEANKQNKQEKPVKNEDAKQTGKRPDKPVTKEANGSQGRWDIQIGSLSSKESAETLLKKVTTQGYKAYVAEAAQGDKTTYKVRIKGSAVKAESAAQAAKIQADGYPIYIVQVK